MGTSSQVYMAVPIQHAALVFGGLSSAPVESDVSDVPGCSNNPSNWVESDGESCSWYALDENCKNFGDGYSGVGNITANDACCACGGGYNPNKKIQPDETLSQRIEREYTRASSAILYRSASLFLAWATSIAVLL
jgi:hypothetical protein